MIAVTKSDNRELPVNPFERAFALIGISGFNVQRDLEVSDNPVKGVRGYDRPIVMPGGRPSRFHRIADYAGHWSVEGGEAVLVVREVHGKVNLQKLVIRQGVDPYFVAMWLLKDVFEIHKDAKRSHIAVENCRLAAQSGLYDRLWHNLSILLHTEEGEDAER